MNNNLSNARLLPFTVIQKAAGGDVEAINAVLKHYAGYIAKLSLRELYDECLPILRQARSSASL